jgi:hypothetical protein
MIHITKLAKEEIVMTQRGGLELLVFMRINTPIIRPTGIAYKEILVSSKSHTDLLSAG